MIIVKTKRNRNIVFLKKYGFITGDEKWITYDNNIQKRSWSKQDEAPRGANGGKGLTPRKVMQCV